MPKGSHVHRPPTPERSPNRARAVAGWAALVLGCLVVVTGLFRTGWLSATLLGVACIAIGLLLVWRIGSWRTVTPAALVLLALSGVSAPQPPVEEAAEAAATSTTTSVVAASTTTATTTRTTTPVATPTTTTTTIPTTTATVVMQTAEPVAVPTMSTTRVIIPATTVASTTVYTPAFTTPPVSIEATTPPVTPTGPSFVPVPEPTPPTGDPVYYEDCAAATAAGAAPVRIGEPGYGPHLDANNDGVGCEN